MYICLIYIYIYIFIVLYIYIVNININIYININKYINIYVNDIRGNVLNKRTLETSKIRLTGFLP